MLPVIASLHPHQEEIKRFEQEVLDGGPVPLAGAISLLTTLNTLTAPAPARWTIVTSASNFYAPQVLARASIPLPSSIDIITSNDVARGKPHPDPYLAGARACNVDPHACESPFVLCSLTLSDHSSSHCDMRVHPIMKSIYRPRRGGRTLWRPFRSCCRLKGRCRLHFTLAASHGRCISRFHYLRFDKVNHTFHFTVCGLLLISHSGCLCNASKAN